MGYRIALIDQQRASPKTSQKAMASFVLGLLSLVFLPSAILGLVYGYKARREVKSRPRELKGLMLANIGLFVSYFVLGFLTLFLLVVFVPAIPKGYKGSQTLAALEQIENLQTALDRYAEAHEGSYPETLANLTETGLIPAEGFLTRPSGYQYSYQPGDIRAHPETGRRLIVGYEFRADPRGILKFIPGAYHFYLDESGVIRYHVGRPADSSSPPLR